MLKVLEAEMVDVAGQLIVQKALGIFTCAFEQPQMRQRYRDGRASGGGKFSFKRAEMKNVFAFGVCALSGKGCGPVLGHGQ